MATWQNPANPPATISLWSGRNELRGSGNINSIREKQF